MKIRKLKPSATQTNNVRLLAFMNEFEEVCNRYGVALRVVSGIYYFDPAVEQVFYKWDFLDRDLEPKIGRK